MFTTIMAIWLATVPPPKPSRTDHFSVRCTVVSPKVKLEIPIELITAPTLPFNNILSSRGSLPQRMIVYDGEHYTVIF